MIAPTPTTPRREPPRATTAPPEPLRPACLMSLSALIVTRGNYERRISAHLHGHGDGLAPEERTHMLEIEEALASHESARQWTYQRPS